MNLRLQKMYISCFTHVENASVYCYKFSRDFGILTPKFLHIYCRGFYSHSGLCGCIMTDVRIFIPKLFVCILSLRLCELSRDAIEGVVQYSSIMAFKWSSFINRLNAIYLKIATKHRRVCIHTNNVRPGAATILITKLAISALNINLHFCHVFTGKISQKVTAIDRLMFFVGK